MKKEAFLKLIKNKLIVSCQAEEGEPLRCPEIMAKISVSVQRGGAVAIRANSKEDIIAIRKATGLPVIGIVKRIYEESDVFITPTIKEIQELIDSGAEVITLDATNRKRPNGVTLEELIKYIRENSDRLVMGDISTESEGIDAIKAGCDFISTTLSGYTPYSRQSDKADFELIQALSVYRDIPVIAEGKINSPEDAQKAYQCGAHSVVVGTAITRPNVITQWFVEGIKKKNWQFKTQK